MRARVLLGWLLAAGLLLIALYGPSTRAHVARAWHPLVYHDDARHQIAPFHRYTEPDLLPDDLLTDYYISLFPVGYHALFIGAAKLWTPLAMSHLLQYVLLAITTAAIAAAAARLAGPAAIPVAATLTFGAAWLWRASGGGLPHSFAFPLVAVGVALLVYGRIGLLAAWAAVAAAFYPMVGVLLGLSLALLLLVTPSRDRGNARHWKLRSRLMVLAATALVMAALQLAPALASRGWGDLVGPDRFSEYPEAGPRGRYGSSLNRPWPDLLDSVPRSARLSLEAGGEPFVPSAHTWLDRPLPDGSTRRPAWITGLLVLGLLGWLGLAARDPAARRLLVLPLALVIAYEAAKLLDPAFYLPIRYVGYAIPTLVWLLVPTTAAGLVGLFTDGARHPRLRTIAVVGAGAALIATLGSGVQLRAGVGQDARRFGRLFAAVRETPRDAVIAGWPTGPIQDVPLVARRNAFLTWEHHQAFHAGYLDTLRVRMRAFVEAYFATTPEPLARLRDEHGVTHLMVDTRHFGERPPTYFSPFQPEIQQAWSHSRGRSWLLQQIESGRGERHGGLVLLPLADIEDG
jgi:hypothetical protein